MQRTVLVIEPSAASDEQQFVEEIKKFLKLQDRNEIDCGDEEKLQSACFLLCPGLSGDQWFGRQDMEQRLRGKKLVTIGFCGDDAIALLREWVGRLRPTLNRKETVFPKTYDYDEVRCPTAYTAAKWLAFFTP